jgi:hypothetical protein
MNGTLIRHAYLPTVTLGWLFIDRMRFATLEEGWRPDPHGPGGQRREGALIESCIPDGTYQVKPHVSAKYPAGVWSLSNPIEGVYSPATRPAGQNWGRDAILIHAGNTIEHIEGCILVGRRHAMDGEYHCVLESRNALKDLRDLLGNKVTHTIHIRPTAGTQEIL